MFVSKILFVLLPISALISAWIFHRLQNQDKLTGGPISVPKALWLSCAIHSWFLIPFIFLFAPGLSAPLRWVIVAHMGSWWLRGVIELFMIYKYFNWTPRYGILHDLFHIVLVLGGLAWVALQVATGSGVFQFLGILFLAVVVIEIGFEITFAYLFLKERGDADHKTYYASDEPRWRRINAITKVGVSIGYGHFFIQAVLAMLSSS